MLKQIIYTVSTRFASLSIGMLTLMLSAKYYGPTGRGYLAGATAMAAMMATIGGFSIGRVLVFEITREKTSPLEYFRKHLFSLLMICGLLSLLIALAASLIYMFYPAFYGKIDGVYYLVAFLAVPALVWSGQSMYVFSSLNEMHVQNIINIAVQCIYAAIACLAVIVFDAGLMHFLILTIACSVLTASVELTYLIRISKPERIVRWAAIASFVKNGIKIHVDTIGGILITTSNIIILNYYLSPREVGIYQLSLQLISLIIVIPAIVSLYFNHDIATLGHDRALLKHARYYYGVIVLILAICCISYVIIPHAIPFVASHEFDDSTVLFRLLLLSVIGNTVCTLFGSQLTSRGYFRCVSCATIAVGSAGLLLSVQLIQQYGIKGAAYSTIVVYTVSMIGNLVLYVTLRNRASRLMMEPAIKAGAQSRT